jgi:hypothetical protein
VIGWVGLVPRVPRNLRAEDRLTVLHSRDLVIACAQIKADATTPQMPTEGQRLGFHFWKLIACHDGHLKGFGKGLFHQTGIEGMCAIGRVLGCQLGAQAGRPLQKHMPGSAGPEQEVEHPRRIAEIVCIPSLPFREDGDILAGDEVFTLFQGDTEVVRIAKFGQCDSVVLYPEGEWPEPRVQRRKSQGCYIEEAVRESRLAVRHGQLREDRLGRRPVPLPRLNTSKIPGNLYLQVLFVFAHRSIRRVVLFWYYTISNGSLRP